MSHYCVGVIVSGKTENEIDEEVKKILEPYDENIQVEPYIYKTKEAIVEYMKELKSKYSSKPLNSFNEHYRDYAKKIIALDTDKEMYNFYRSDNKEERFDDDGNEITTYNPKSKWDWWCYGGRFSDMGDIVKVSEFKPFRELSKKEISDLCKLWDYYCGKIELTDKEAEELGDIGFFKKEYYVERYGDIETFLKDASARCPMAIVDENDWYELGGVGWFGIDDANPSSIKAYYEFVEKFFTDSKNQDKQMVFVDCHI